jgi:hypothetical protein
MTSLRLKLVAAALALLAGTASAQPASNASRADALNNEGKAAMQDSNFAAASEKFHQAILLSPEGRFYFNLCVSLYSQGKLSDALAACKEVEAAGADPGLREKTSKMTNKIKEEIRKLGFDPDAPTTPTTDPNNPTTDPNNPTTDPNNPTTDPNNPTTDPNNPTTDPNNPNNPTNPTGTQPAIVAPPPLSVIKSGVPEHQYTWTLGFELLGGTGKFGVDEAYSDAMYGFRFLGDYLVAPARQIGLQATIGVMHTNEDEDSGELGIDVVDIGLNGYKHLCKGRLCVTPLIGASLGLMQPSEIESDDALLAIGFRAEARLGYAFGTRFEHLLSVSLGFQGYTKAFDSSAFDAETLGLDEMSAVGVIALGYTYRFNTPFGSSPFVTLE